MSIITIEEMPVTAATYRDNEKPRRVYYVDVADVKPRDIPGFMAGVKAAMEAMDIFEAKLG